MLLKVYAQPMKVLDKRNLTKSPTNVGICTKALEFINAVQDNYVWQYIFLRYRYKCGVSSSCSRSMSCFTDLLCNIKVITFQSAAYERSHDAQKPIYTVHGQSNYCLIYQCYFWSTLCTEYQRLSYKTDWIYFCGKNRCSKP